MKNIKKISFSLAVVVALFSLEAPAVTSVVYADNMENNAMPTHIELSLNIQKKLIHMLVWKIINMF